jgi:hypothetical protein
MPSGNFHIRKHCRVIVLLDASDFTCNLVPTSLELREYIYQNQDDWFRQEQKGELTLNQPPAAKLLRKILPGH